MLDHGTGRWDLAQIGRMGYSTHIRDARCEVGGIGRGGRDMRDKTDRTDRTEGI